MAMKPGADANTYQMLAISRLSSFMDNER